MIFILFGIVWLYLFYNSKKQKINKPWGFGLIIICVFLGSSYISFFDKTLRVNPLFILITILLLFGPEEFKACLFDPKWWKISLMLGVILGLLFSLVLYKFGVDKELSTNLPISGKIFYIFQNTVGEEILFRGFLLSYLLAQKFKPGYANLIQTLCFLSGHVYWLGIPTGVLYFVFSGLFGWIAGYILLKYKNISGPILMHLIVNLASVLYFR